MKSRYAVRKRRDPIPDRVQAVCEFPKKDDGEFLSGSYTLSPTMNYDELLAAFKPQKPSGTSRITIPEGYTTYEIIDLLVAKGIGTREGYIDVINNYDYDYWFIDELEADGWEDGRFYRLDGYLFPDTYEFYNASSEEVVINKLLKRFGDVFADSYRIKAAELGYSVDQVLTLASMIEKEPRRRRIFQYFSVFTTGCAFRLVPISRERRDRSCTRSTWTGVRTNLKPDDTAYDSPYNTYYEIPDFRRAIAIPARARSVRRCSRRHEVLLFRFRSSTSRITRRRTTST